MNLELTRRQIVGVAVFLLVSLAALGLMFIRLGAVPLPGRHTRTIDAVVADAGGLPPQADVLIHGVRVGTVSAVAPDRASTRVTLALSAGTPHLHPDATIRIGQKTPLGEPFVELDPGRQPGRLAPGAAPAIRGTVAIDDALAFLDAHGRANLRGLLAPLGRAAAAPGTASELSATLARLGQSTDAVAGLAAELRAQRGDLTGIVQNGQSVLAVLAGRASELSRLMVSARTGLGAVGGERTALDGTLVRLPGVLARARATLAAARPLIADATPLAGRLETAAPPLSAALRALPATTAAARQVLAAAPAIAAAVPPVIDRAGALAGPAAATLGRLAPALADIVPVAQYLGPRGRTVAAWFANTADLGSHGDAKGDWARFFVLFDPSTLFGNPSGAPPGNAYTAPGDAAHNAAYRPGGFPRLLPYSPALRGN